jgi:hypothetical protein
LPLQSQALHSIPSKAILRFNGLLTNLAETHLLVSNLGANAMNLDHDRYLLVRAGLVNQLQLIKLTDFQANPLKYLIRLEALREAAIRHNLGTVAEIAAMFEESLERSVDRGGSSAMIDSFVGILDDAIGCTQLEPQAAQALLASIAVRQYF